MENGKYLDPKADLTFKKVFGEHEDLVMSLLNALLPLDEGRQIEHVEYMQPELVPENPGKKNSIVDVRCRGLCKLRAWYRGGRLLQRCCRGRGNRLRKRRSQGALRGTYKKCPQS